MTYSAAHNIRRNADHRVRRTPPENVQLFRSVLLWTVVLELATLVLRFGFSLESTRDTASTIGVMTAGLRVHHSYLGILLLPVAAWLPRRAGWCERKLSGVAGGLVCSDLVHHFAVLWIITGSPQFDLFY
ncbi:MAG: hypothetical protein ACKO2P_19380 [Planctomycetota bacterium]